MAEHKLVDGVQIELTPQEIAQREQDEIAWNNGAFDRAIANLRAKRNALLAKTDYLVLQDSTLTPQKKSEWMTYRTNLRDLTKELNTVEQINNVSFPVKPQ